MNGSGGTDGSRSRDGATEPNRAGVVIADDHEIVRLGIRSLLEATGRYEMVASVANGEAARDAVFETTAPLVVLDSDMPGLDPFCASAEIKRRLPATGIVFFAHAVQDGAIDAAMRAGASAFVAKADSASDLVTALDSVREGKTHFSPIVSRRVDARSDRSAEHVSRVNLLTGREREVLVHIAKGYSKKEIAAMLHISVKTVEKHSQQLMNKLSIHDRVDLARFAIREALIEA